MARRKIEKPAPTKGACAFCGASHTRGGMSRHLRACAKRAEAVAAADAGSRKRIPLLHIIARDPWAGTYWLHLEMNGDAELGELDHYLRVIWLECCDHLSQFAAKRWGDEIDMDELAARVLAPPREIVHQYDFGTTSDTIIQALEVRRGAPLTREPIVLMARNEMPQEVCMKCDAPATWFCMECRYAHGDPGFLCDKHEKRHPHRDDWGPPMGLFNSPRTAMCGYCGPAEPPY